MIFELVFITFLLAGIVTVSAALRSALRGRGRRAVRLLVGCGVAAALYLGTVVIVSLNSPRRVLEVGEDWCFDDWCVAVSDVTLASELGPPERLVRTDGVFYVVRLRLSNHARGRTQRAGSAAAYLVDGRGDRYDVSHEAQAALEAQEGPARPLTAPISAGQSIDTVQVFDLPREASEVGLTVEHPVGFSPGLFVIGDQASLFHERTVVRLR